MLSKYKYIFAIILPMIAMNTQNVDATEKLDAGFVLNQMDEKNRSGFIAGIVEGLAYARFLRDKPNDEGMRCVTGWYYQDTAKRWKTIKAVFTKYQDKPPAVLVHLLIKKECGA